jgi:threonine/homoserine/homoserine lactone efflux protein
MVILKSLLLGFLYTLPFGPVGILALRKILELGPWRAFLLGSSQVLAIFIFTIMSLFSVSFISEFILEYQFWLRLVLGMVLMAYGIHIYFAKPSNLSAKHAHKQSFLAEFFLIGFLMLSNPGTWVSFLASFAAFGLYTTSHIQQVEVILGIFIGSILSWALICLCFIRRKKSSCNIMGKINRIAGLFFALCGAVLALSAMIWETF